MRIKLRGFTRSGDDFDLVREFEYTFELYTIIQEVLSYADRFEIFLSRDVNTADAEFSMGLACGGDWANGRCFGPGGALIRMTTNGGRA